LNRINNQWSLFGLDLSRVIDHIKLGLRQIFWGEECGLRRRYFPKAHLVNGDQVIPDDYPCFTQSIEPQDASIKKALVVPASMILSKALAFPEAAEVDLEAAIRFEASSSSPFAEEDTCYGWRLLSRESGLLNIVLVIASRSAVTKYCENRIGESLQSEVSFEVWAEAESCLVQLVGFGEASRRREYFGLLLEEAKRVAMVAIGVLLVIYLPAKMLDIRANQLTGLLDAAQNEAVDEVAARNELVSLEARLSRATDFFANRLAYDDWLNAIADITPDSVYFTRLSFDQDRLTVSGMAINAAEYQTILAGSGLVAELSAPSAFTRDSRTGRERFTLTMRVNPTK